MGLVMECVRVELGLPVRARNFTPIIELMKWGASIWVWGLVMEAWHFRFLFRASGTACGMYVEFNSGF
jgi:hypothetical protein